VFGALEFSELGEWKTIGLCHLKCALAGVKNLTNFLRFVN
jgi:hypothetical protein